jgi:hypothetical protein
MPRRVVGAHRPRVGGRLRFVIWNRDTIWRIPLAYPDKAREQHHFHKRRRP